MLKLSAATFVAIAAATLVSAPVPAAPTDSNNTPIVEKVPVQDWCAGPRRNTDFRCFKAQ
jgi:hypothetical protein